MHSSDEKQYGKEFPNGSAAIINRTANSLGLMNRRPTPTRGRASVTCEVLGVTEADIRAIEPALMVDVYQVRLWNGRRLHVTGLDMTRGELDAQDQEVDWSEFFPRRSRWCWWRNVRSNQ